MRTPEAIFEEVLDAWDERETAHILNTPYPGDRGGEAMDRHTERVRYLRQEFRAAMQRGVEATARDGVDAGVRIGKVAGPPAFDVELVPLPEPAAEGAASVLGPCVGEGGGEHCPCFLSEGDTCCHCGERWEERPDERGERLAARYTRDDGSSR